MREHPEHETSDEMLARLEDVLLDLPFDRAVPELDVLLARAEADPAVVLADERALKLLHEALVARPFGSLDAVRQVRTEVELLTLEVELLTDRLREPGLTDTDARRVESRLRQVGDRLGELAEQL